jgi:predicted RNA-binding Zn ribbon-like protein
MTSTFIVRPSEIVVDAQYGSLDRSKKDTRAGGGGSGFTVAWDALRLLGDPERFPRVKRCPGRNCGWLFVNTSGRRRWCSMRACGSREKMRRAYARKRRARESSASS